MTGVINYWYAAAENKTQTTSVGSGAWMRWLPSACKIVCLQTSLWIAIACSARGTSSSTRLLLLWQAQLDQQQRELGAVMSELENEWKAAKDKFARIAEYEQDKTRHGCWGDLFVCLCSEACMERCCCIDWPKTDQDSHVQLQVLPAHSEDKSNDPASTSTVDVIEVIWHAP